MFGLQKVSRSFRIEGAGHLLLEGSCEGGDPAGVALQGTAVYELLSHYCGSVEDG